MRYNIWDDLKTYAADLTSPPRLKWSYTKVEVDRRGQRLAAARWQGKQWSATDYGVECRNGCFQIPVSRLWECEEAGGWVARMYGKSWVDIEDFSTALKMARRYAASTKYRPVAIEAKRAAAPQ